MAWANPFRRRDENTRRSWGVTFQWTDKHSSSEELHPLKYTYDVLGEECLNRLDEISPPQNPALPRNQNRDPVNAKREPVAKRDLYALLRDNAATDEKLGELWREVNTIPDWVDWNQIERGQEVFYRYGGPALTAVSTHETTENLSDMFKLAYQSLLGGMAASRVTEVLARTGGFSPKVARGRMYETTQHILQCTLSLESIKPGGDGFASSLRVRLLHAAVRRRILALAKHKPDYYSVEKFGIPINDLDCIGTISTFSTSLIWLGWPRQGIYLRQQEIEDYIALWRLIAHYLGTPTEVFATTESAKAMMESLLVSEINPSDMSKVMANNIILSLQNIPPSYPSREFLVASARWLNGDELSDALGLERPAFYYKALVAGQCLFFVFLCYSHRSFDYLDKKKIKVSLHNAVSEVF